MTKVIKEEFEKLESLNIGDDSSPCNTSLEIFYEEFIRMSRMDDDLFTYEVEISGLANIPCDLNEDDGSEQHMTNGSGDDLEGGDEVKLTDKESFNSDVEDEVAEIFRIDTNISLLKLLMDLRLTKNIRMIGYISGIKMCHGCMKDHGQIMEHGKNPSRWKDDGYCNGRNLPGAYIVGNTLCYQDLEWYEALKDSKLKEEALKNQAIIEGMIDEHDKSSNKGWRSWDNFKNTNRDNNKSEYEMEHEDEERYKLFDDQERSVCNIRRFEMIKYSFGDDEEYVAIK
ncbi:hypothetical protein Tco_1225322 [Tanacetum coccineum]